MSHDTCRVCGTAAHRAFSHPVLGRPVDYFDCAHCGYLQTQTPDWLDQAYAQAISPVDTGLLQRNRVNVGRVVMTLASCGRLGGRVLDDAGGYGVLVRMLRDAGIDAWWRDKYAQNLMAQGFEAEPGPYDLLTAFEVFEHLLDPLAELRQMLQQAPVVLISTELVPTPGPPPQDWWYLGGEHGQHIGFFRRRTLEAMAREAGCHLRSDDRAVHVFSHRKLPASWHHWMRVARAWPLLTRALLRSRTAADHARAGQASR